MNCESIVNQCRQPWSSVIDTIIWCPSSSYEAFIQSDARHGGIRFPRPKGVNGTLHQADLRLLSDRYSVMIIGDPSDLLIFRVLDPMESELGCSTKLCRSGSPYMHPTSYRAYLGTLLPFLRWVWTLQSSLLILRFAKLGRNGKSKSLLFHSWVLNLYACVVICLFAEHLVATFNRSEHLLTRLRSGNTKDQLGIQLPGSGEVPSLGNRLIDEGAVVLKVGAEALGLKSSPDFVIVSLKLLVSDQRREEKYIPRYWDIAFDSWAKGSNLSA